MRLLLDTHLLLWALATPERLDAATRAVLEEPDNEVLFSAASLWEIAIKAGLGRADSDFEPQQIFQAALDTGFVELPARSAAAVLVAGLPPHHRDPFDRLLVAQAMAEPVRLYTADPLLPPYSELVTLVR
ncbi:type II toxin-antitoxin system VapC family toxin [Roseomonas sp. E05]|uniref:type II toxin-antitoxin system VapC family toxin n=1 Tax=Roseomonas sp. E05 TaxID=3046310 RepID=UPI0024B9370C|nr:type II toxin-antitoxin system VapC family toxin [Roseomonas sp. E05]MDJ0390274.1 type II toxin-antitoxin system VapC family toxin [Roseomonas sp. E05]